MSAEPAKKEAPLKYLALGDSYTIGESIPPSDRYPCQLVNLLKSENIVFEEPEIIATTGWTTRDLLSAMGNHLFHPVYDLVTLLIGANNQYQGSSFSEYATEFRILLNKGIQLAGGHSSRVVVLSIPDYAYTPFAAGSDTDSISRMIDKFNLINKDITQEFHCGWLDVTTESKKIKEDSSLIAGDGLHYSGKEYAIWANLLLAKVSQIVKQK